MPLGQETDWANSSPQANIKRENVRKSEVYRSKFINRLIHVCLCDRQTDTRTSVDDITVSLINRLRTATNGRRDITLSTTE